MSGKIKSSDPDIRASLPVLRRAARRARRLAARTRTPVYVLRHGRVVDLHARKRSPSKKRVG